MLRIIAGRHRSRQLLMPDAAIVRPTTDRTREAIFSMLTHRLGEWDGVKILDACCGSGAFGLEAISRGAAHATFLDNSAPVLKLARENATKLGEAQKCQFILGSVTCPPQAHHKVDLLMMDAPYNQGLSISGLLALTQAGWTHGATLGLIETARKEEFTAPAGWTLLDSRPHGPAQLWTLAKIEK
jgi:16S rRNA (guanine966-N2)-methyltransferase